MHSAVQISEFECWFLLTVYSTECETNYASILYLPMPFLPQRTTLYIFYLELDKIPTFWDV